jgi:hypothetical protein
VINVDTAQEFNVIHYCRTAASGGELVARQLNKWQEKNLIAFKFGAVLRAHVALRSAPIFF